MYNLFVSSNEESWNGEPYIFEEINRCVRNYTTNEITEKYGDFTESQVDEIKKFPCIFAYEDCCKKDPKFGRVRNITRRQERVKIEYEIIDLDNFLNFSSMSDMLFDLDITKYEMNRTHWSIKDIDLSKELASKSIYLSQWISNKTKTVDITKHKFDVALSFPGEFRAYVEQITEEFERILEPNSYFYDNNYIAQLARPSLDTLLQDIYRNRSKLVVVFLCEKYQEKEWCGIEFRAIKEIIMAKQDKVMFVRMDDGQVEGVFRTDGYIDGQTHNATAVAGFIQERISLLS